MDKSSLSVNLNQGLSLAPSSIDLNAYGNDSNISGQHPSTAPSSNVNNLNEQHTDTSLTVMNMAFVWFFLVALYYICGPRRSHVTIDQRLVQERLQQLRDEEAAKKRRRNPDKRKEEINEQIMTKVLTGMKKKSLDPPVQISHSCSSTEEEKATEEYSNASVKNTPILHIQDTDCNMKDGQELVSYDTNNDIEANHKCNTSLQPEEDSDVDMECSVCLEVFEAGDKLSWSRTLRCEHIFHHECLMPWLMTHDECPYCRTKIINDCCENDTKVESIEATIYSDFPPVDNGDSNDEESHVDDNAISKLKRTVRRCLCYFQPPRSVTRIDTEHNETMIFQEYLMDF